MDHFAARSMLQHSLLLGPIFSPVRGEFPTQEPELWWPLCHPSSMIIWRDHSQITRTLTCKEGNEFSLGYLETMRVVVNMDSHWSILHSDDEGVEQPPEEPKHQTRLRKRNVRARGEMGRAKVPPQHFEAGVPTDLFQSKVGTYLDNLRGEVTYNTQILEAMFSHMNVVRPPTVPPQCPYIPTWEELWMPRGDGVRTSGENVDDDDD